jgi:hypothetical protein
MGRTRFSKSPKRSDYPLALTVSIYAAWLVGVSDALATTYLVRPDGSGDFPSISSAVAAAQDGDEILLGDGVFSGAQNRNNILVEKTLTIRSESGDPSRCTIDCEQHPRGGVEPNRAFYFFHTLEMEPVLEGITITRGYATLGGAVLCWYSSPRISNCVFVGNTAWEGGAIMADESSPTVQNCVIINNVATELPGGGIFAVDSNMVIQGCTISQNAVMNNREGGGISVWGDSNIEVHHSIISGQLVGEAVYCEDGAIASLSCTNVFGNAGGDWVGCIADQLKLNGNFSLDPIFCNPSEGIFTIREDSPCAPPGITGCGLVGALPIGCDVVSITESTWGKIKAAYR